MRLEAKSAKHVTFETMSSGKKLVMMSNLLLHRHGFAKQKTRVELCRSCVSKDYRFQVLIFRAAVDGCDNMMTGL